MRLALSVAAAGGVADITQLAPQINWAGDISQCGRTLSFGVLVSPVDTNIPVAEIPLGAGVTLAADDKTLFEGYVFDRQKLTSSNTMDITCFDRGIYVKRNKTSYKFAGMTPEAVTKRLCDDFDINTGALAQTGVKVSRNFIGSSLYQMIQTVYTLASRSTGDAYHVRFEGSSLTVLTKGVKAETLVIQGGSNLMSAAVTESIKQMVSQVAIYGADDKLITTVRNGELIKLYGVMQEYIKQSKGDDANARAQKLLDDNGVSQKITLNNMGNIACITGDAVVVQEPYTGLYGLFWVESDTHTWKNGLYLNKLTLNFRRMMDEQEVGSLPVAKYSGSGAKKAEEPVTNKWEYLHKPGQGLN